MKQIVKDSLAYGLAGTLAFLATMTMSAQNRRDVPQTFENKDMYDVVRVAPTKGKKVKNVILMISDGTGTSHFASALVANGGKLNITENAMAAGLVRTTCANKLITDSGAAASAMATGEKADYHTISVNSDGSLRQTIMDDAKKKNLATGVVATVQLTDATPAAFCAHHTDRNDAWELAPHFLESNVDFIFGGGSKYFANRPDGRDLFAEMKAKGYLATTNADEVLNANSAKVFCLTDSLEMPPAEKRDNLLSKASLKAVETLSKQKNGFFLMIEGSQSDDYAHGNDLYNTMMETLDFDKATGEMLKWAEANGETLVLVVADHETGGLSLLDGNEAKGSVTAKFTNGGHTGVLVSSFAYGPGSDAFGGVYDNNEIFHKIKRLLGL